MKDTKDNEKEKSEEKINFQSLGNICLIIIVVLILGNALLIYYMANYSDNNAQLQNIVTSNVVEIEEQDNESVDSIADIINTTIMNNSQTNTTVDATEVDTKKLMNEEQIVLYNGLILDTGEMKQVELKYIDNNNINKDKYVITYYNYENYKFVDSTLGKLSEPKYENLLSIDNVGKIAISENYNAIPKDIKIINTLPTVVIENNEKLAEFDTIKTIIADLDMNNLDEYITILANKKIGYSKISLYDNSGKLVADLAYIDKNKWNKTNDLEYYLGLENVNIIDVDNDNIMEILVEIPKYEGQPSVSILKYKNNKLDGKTNIECSLLP